MTMDLRKIICNKNTVRLARKQMFSAYRKCYLTLQQSLLGLLKNSKDNTEKKELADKILEVGKIYQQIYQNQQKSGN